MKLKKGFTLIELLAVLVILVVIAIITTPIILNMVENSKSKSSLSSSLGYIRTIENYIVSNAFEVTDTIKEGVYDVSTINDLISAKGVLPSYGVVKVGNNDKVSSAMLCVDGYSIFYSDSKNEIVTDDYCLSSVSDFEVRLYINSTLLTNQINLEQNTSFNLSSYNISTFSNITCNNQAVPTINGTTLNITNAFGDVTCRFYTSLESAVNALSNTKSHILMLKNTAVINRFTFNNLKDVEINLNGKEITYSSTSDVPLMNNYGILKIFDNVGTGKITVNYRMLNNYGKVYFLNGTYVRSNPASTSGGLICNSLNATVNIEGGSYLADTVWTIFNHTTTNSNSSITIKNSEVYSQKTSALVNRSTATLNVENSYVYSDESIAVWSDGQGAININGGTYIGVKSGISTTWKSTINVSAATTNINGNVFIDNRSSGGWSNAGIATGTGVINIDGVIGETDNLGNYISGVYITTASGQGIRLQGTGYINGVRVNSYDNGLSNEGSGITNITNSIIESKNVSSLKNLSTNNIFVCNSLVGGPKTYDVYIGGTGYIYYDEFTRFKKDVLFDSINTPSRIVKDININCVKS